MTAKQLKQYRLLCQEIEALDIKIKKEQGRNIPIVAGIVKGSMTSYPYTETRIGVEMEEPKRASHSGDLMQIYEKRKMQAEVNKIEIENYISDIENAQIRLILQYRFIDGLGLQEVAKKVGYSRSRISQIILQNIKD